MKLISPKNTVRYGLRGALVAVACTPACLTSSPQNFASEREVSGVVLDSHHGPLRGAVVQLEDESTTAITTFLTDQDGHYNFKHISANDDYRLSATYRGHRSKSKELSRFSSKTAPVVRLVVRSR